jgi:hypothetical protein
VAENSELRLGVPLWNVLELESKRSGHPVEIVAAAAIAAFCHMQRELSSDHHVLAHRSSMDPSDPQMYLTSMPTIELSIDADASSIETYVVATNSSQGPNGQVIPMRRRERPTNA